MTKRSCDEVGELEDGVAVVAVPVDEEVVVDGAVAARFVVEVVEVVGHSVGEEGVEGIPGELAFGDGVVDGGVAAGNDVEDEGDEAVLAVAAGEEKCALSLMIEQGVAVLHGQFALAGIVEQGVCYVVVYTQVVVVDAVAGQG